MHKEMVSRKSDKDVLREYCAEMERPYPSGFAEEMLLVMIAKLREQDPRINDGFDVCVLESIWDEDDIEPEMNKYFAEKEKRCQKPS